MLQPHQQRVVDEQKELETKLIALTAFLDKGKPVHINLEDWEDLTLQEESMDSYNQILKRRISRF